MSATEQIADAEVVEPAPGTEVAVRHEPALAVNPHADATELVGRLNTIKQAMATAMVPDVDYGVIPGTNKPSLLKPGAEKLAVLFQLDVQYTVDKAWDGDHLTVSVDAVVYHQLTGIRMGAGEGLCSTREKKYAKRKAQRECPECGQAAIIKGKAEYGGGWLCFKKKDGCGAKFPEDDERITSQVTGDVDNPDLPDSWNPVVKIAKKRAYVDAILAATAASAVFTQDAEETPQTPPAPAEDARPYGPEFDAKLLAKIVGAACTRLADGDPEKGKALFKLIKRDCGGYFPQAAALAVMHCAETSNLVPDVAAPDPS